MIQEGWVLENINIDVVDNGFITNINISEDDRAPNNENMWGDAHSNMSLIARTPDEVLTIIKAYLENKNA